MIKLEIENLKKVVSKHGFSTTEMEKESGRIGEFLGRIEERDQGFYKIVDDEALLAEIEKYAQEVRGKYDDLVVLGIGGSALGTICLQQSLKHLFENERDLLDRCAPKLHVLDNIDPALISEIQDVINLEKTLFIVVTKSGGTPETLSQYFYFRHVCEENELDFHDHFLFITDPEKGLLRDKIQEEGLKSFEVPPNIGGRFSVLTAVGLVPAALIGIDIRELVAGAREMRNQFLNEDFSENMPFQMATIQYGLAKKGKIMNVMMPYSQRLIKLADWYRQLLAESIGKELNEKGETVNVGITPVNALGATDQHSQSQLYNEGPNDKFFIFIEVENHGKELKIPNLYPENDVVKFLCNVDFGKLLNVEKKGTEMAYTKNDRPNITLVLDQVSPKSLGQLFMLFEGATAFLGEFFGIDAFNQPGVELSKNLTKELLLEEGCE